MSFKSLMQSLMNRCYTRQASDKSEIAGLSTLDWEKKVVLKEAAASEVVLQTVVSPGNGVIFSYINGDTNFNGLQGNEWLSLINHGGKAGANSCVSAPVSKGASVTIHNANATSQIRRWYFVPFMGGGLRSLVNLLQSGGAPCLRLKNCSTLWRRESVLRNRKEPSSILFRSKADLLMSHTLPHSTATHAFAHGRAITAQLATKLSPSKTQSISAVELCGGRKCSATCGLSSHAEKVTQFSLEWAFQKVETFKEELPSTLVSALPNLCANCEEVHYVA